MSVVAKNHNDKQVKAGQALLWLLMVYYAFEYLRLHDSYLAFLGPLKFVGILSFSLLGIFLIKPKKYLKESLAKKLILFLLLIVVWVPFAVNNYFAYATAQSMFMTIVAVVFPSVLIIDTQGKLIKFLHFWVILHIALAIIIIQNGGTGMGSFIKDENDAACVLNMGVAYSFYMAMLSKNSFFVRNLYLFFSLVMSLGVVYTASRGGFLGYIAVVGMIVVLSKNKVRNFMKVVAVAVALSGALVAALPEGYFDEMKTITDTENSTRKERFYSWEIAWIMFKHNPVFGVGPFNYPWHVGRYERMASHWQEGHTKSLSGRAAHSTFFTLIPELGLVGIIIFCLIVYEAITICRRIIKDFHDKPEGKPEEYYWFSKAAIVAITTYMINSVFITTLYYPTLWHLIGFVLAMKLTYPLKSDELGGGGKLLRKARKKIHKTSLKKAQA